MATLFTFGFSSSGSNCSSDSSGPALNNTTYTSDENDYGNSSSDEATITTQVPPKKKHKRQFQENWIDKWPWLVYDSTRLGSNTSQ